MLSSLEGFKEVGRQCGIRTDVGDVKRKKRRQAFKANLTLIYAVWSADPPVVAVDSIPCAYERGEDRVGKISRRVAGGSPVEWRRGLIKIGQEVI